MKPKETVQIRQQEPFFQGSPGYFQQGGSPYPGIESSFFGGGAPNLPATYIPPQTPTVGGGGGGGAAGGGSSFNLGQVKGFIDRMGGIEGIMGTMTRVQKVVSSFQQMAPMIKLLLGSFGGGKASAQALVSAGTKHKPYRKRSRKKSRRPLRKYRITNGKTWTPKGKKYR